MRLVSLFSIPFLLFIGLGILIGAICWPYSINTWLIFAHKAPVVTWWQGVLIGCVPGIGHLGLVIAAITWIAMLFLR